jgi:hypothetical protein
MKICSVNSNKKRKSFDVNTASKKHVFPYSRSDPAPSRDNPVTRVFVDKEIGGEGFSYELASGKTGTVLLNKFWSTTKIRIFSGTNYSINCLLRRRGELPTARCPNVKSSGD